MRAQFDVYVLSFGLLARRARARTLLLARTTIGVAGLGKGEEVVFKLGSHGIWRMTRGVSADFRGSDPRFASYPTVHPMSNIDTPSHQVKAVLKGWSGYSTQIFVSRRPPMMGTVVLEELEELMRKRFEGASGVFALLPRLPGANFGSLAGPFYFLVGNAGTGATFAANRRAFQLWKIVYVPALSEIGVMINGPVCDSPRMLRDSTQRDISVRHGMQPRRRRRLKLLRYRCSARYCRRRSLSARYVSSAAALRAQILNVRLLPGPTDRLSRQSPLSPPL